MLIGAPSANNAIISTNDTTFSSGGNWSEFKSALNTDNTNWLAGFFDIHRSTDEGSNWTHVLDAPSFRFVTCIGYDRSGRFVAVSDDGKRNYSDNGGATWSSWVQIKSGFTYGVISIVYSTSYWIVGTSSGGISRSIDGSGTWSHVVNEGDPPFNGANVSGLGYDSSTGTVVAVSSNGYVYRSTNDGSSWTEIDDFGGLSNGLIAVTSDNNGNWVAVGNSGDVAYSNDDGLNWTLISANGGESIVYGNDRFIAASDITSKGMSYSDNLGLTWTEITDSSEYINYLVGTPVGGGSSPPFQELWTNYVNTIEVEK